MFSKHVWFDREQMAEVYLDDAGLVTGTLIAFRGASCLINPRPEVLSAMYHESRLRRILGISVVVITEPRMDFTRGLCSLVGYSRGMRRHAPLTILTRKDARISSDFLSSCTRLSEPTSFPVDIVTLTNGHPHEVGEGSLRFVRHPGSNANPVLAVRSGDCTIQYYDHSHVGEVPESGPRGSRADVLIRAADLSAQYAQVRHRLITSPSDSERDGLAWPLTVLDQEEVRG